MIMDADVLIDFIKVDRSIIRLFVNKVGPMFVASPVAEEVGEVKDVRELTRIGLIIVEPEIEDAFEAAGEPKGPLSFCDKLCFLIARRNGYTCVTNDKNLRKLCQRENVSILWSLELLIELYVHGGISLEDALKVAAGIQEVNPKHITREILERFEKKIREIIFY